jgi:hypothetical protein
MRNTPLSPEFIANIREVTSAKILARLEAISAERRTLRELLRVVERREREAARRAARSEGKKHAGH